VAAVVALLVSLWLPGGDPGGYWIPKHPPDEANRIHHPSGFSIVRPPDWIAEASSFEESDTDTLVLAPGCKRMRYCPRINVTRLTQPPELEGFSEATLGPYQAHRKLDVQIGGGDEPYFMCEYVVLSRQTWFRIVYVTPNGPWGKPQYNDVPVEIAKYLETFRDDTPPPGRQTSGDEDKP
jgi:hypothetical protein